MTTKFKFNFSLWIGVCTGIYAVIYSFSPLGQTGIMPISFVAFAIFFASGANREEFINFALCFSCGVGWAKICIFTLGLTASLPMPEVYSSALTFVVFITMVTFVHFIIPEKFRLNKTPGCFGGILSTLLLGGDMAIPVLSNLIAGLIFAYVCASGALFLTPKGDWTLPSNVKTDQG